MSTDFLENAARIAATLGRLCPSGTACRRVTSILVGLVLATVSAQAAGTPEEQSAAPSPTVEPKRLSLYATAGIGGTSVGLAARGLLTVAYGCWFVGPTASASYELNFFGPHPSQEQQDVGMVGGVHTRGSFYVAGFGAGLAYVHSVKRGSYLRMSDNSSSGIHEEIERRSLGVPVLAHASLYWGPLGVGVMTFVNLNTTLPTVGAAGTLSLGVF